MRARVHLLLASLLLLGLTPGVSANQGADGTADGTADEFTVIADEAGCSSATFCFKLASGNLSQLAPGDEVELTLRNEGANVHNLFVTRLEHADPAHRDTRRADAVAGTEDLGRGESETLRFTVPNDAEGLYLWCDIAGHEGGGMWLQVSFGPDGSVATGETTQQAPGVGLLGVLLVGFGVARIGRAGRRE